MNAFNYIISIYSHIYSIKGYIALICVVAPLHILRPLQYFHISPDTYTHYICSRYECKNNNIHTEQNTWEYLATYILFHLLAATAIPFAAKYIADNIIKYITRKITNLVTCINITPFPQHHLQIEDINEQHELNTDYEYTIPTFLTHHMTGHIPPIRTRQRQSFGRLASHQYRHTPRTYNMFQNTRNTRNTRNTVMSRIINMSILTTLFTNTNHIDTEPHNQKSTGIPTWIDNSYVHTATKTFAGDACPICMIKFHILEINNNTLAATTPCKHLFCHTCIDKYINNHSMAQVPCPLCRDIVEELYINK